MVSLAGVLDLVAADPTAALRPAHRHPELTAGLAAESGTANLLLGGRYAELPERHRWSSPAHMASAGVPLLAVHGENDEVVAPSYSRTYAEVEVVVLPATRNIHALS